MRQFFSPWTVTDTPSPVRPSVSNGSKDNVSGNDDGMNDIGEIQPCIRAARQVRA